MNLFTKLLLGLLLVSHQVTIGLVAISLGGDCTIATLLRNLKIRKEAYPFDWMYVPFDAACQAFEDDFQHFLEPNSLRIGEDKRVVVDYYGLQYVHDFPTIQHGVALSDAELHPWAEIRADWQQFTNPIREKYLRRVRRLRHVLKSNARVFLIYAQITNNPGLEAINHITKEKAIKLRDLLRARYPQLDFTLVLFVNPPDQPYEWGLERIRNFPILEPLKPYFLEKWLAVLKLLNIPYSLRSQSTKELCSFDPACTHLFE